MLDPVRIRLVKGEGVLLPRRDLEKVLPELPISLHRFFKVGLTHQRVLRRLPVLEEACIIETLEPWPAHDPERRQNSPHNSQDL